MKTVYIEKRTSMREVFSSSCFGTALVCGYMVLEKEKKSSHRKVDPCAHKELQDVTDLPYLSRNWPQLGVPSLVQPAASLNLLKNRFSFEN